MPQSILEPEALGQLATRAVGGAPVRARAGDVLFRPGDDCQGFLALRSGIIRVSICSAAGRELVLYRVRPGEICLQTFTCLVQKGRYAAEGVAETEVDAVLLPPGPFDRLMAHDQDFRFAVLSSVASRFGALEDMVQALAFSGLSTRLAQALLARCGPTGEVRATHEALAAEIGSAREAVTRQLSVFVRDGLVAVKRGQILIQDRRGLERLRQASA